MPFLIIILLYTLRLCESNAAVHELHKILDFPGQELIGNYESFKGGNLTFLVCQANHTINEKNCKLIREKLFSSNSNLTCNVIVKHSNVEEDGKITNAMEVVPIEGNNALLYSITGHTDATITIYTIELDTCKKTEMNIDVKNVENPIRELIIVSYDEFYDIFYSTADSRYEKVSISNKGEKISGPINSMNSPLRTSHYPRILPVSNKSPEKGFVSLIYDVNNSKQNNSLDLTIFKPDGSMSSLGRYEVSRSSMISTTHDLIGMCFSEDEIKLLYRCVQYDQDGQLKFQSDPIENDRSEILFAQNLQEGGFVLLAGKSEDSTMDSAHKDIRFFAIKLDSTGKLVGLVDLHEINFPYRIEVAVSLYENESNEYCASMARFYSREYDRNSTFLEVKSQCFKDSDFTKEHVDVTK